MVAAGTVDEDIYSMGERKKEVNKSVLNDAASKDKDAVSTISGLLCMCVFVCTMPWGRVGGVLTFCMPLQSDD